MYDHMLLLMAVSVMRREPNTPQTPNKRAHQAVLAGEASLSAHPREPRISLIRPTTTASVACKDLSGKNLHLSPAKTGFTGCLGKLGAPGFHASPQPYPGPTVAVPD